MSPRAIVVGAGATGLTCARVLQERGFRVAVRSAEPTPATTSAVAAAFFYPYLVEPADGVARWSAAALPRFCALADDPATGVHLRTMIELFPTPTPLPSWAVADPTASLASADLLRAGRPFGHRFTLPVIETPTYLPWLRDQILAAGGTLESGNVDDLHALASAADVIVDAAGLGARTLAPDDAVYPVRGQLVRVRPVSDDTTIWLDKFGPDGMCYVVPRARDVVLGGTSEPVAPGTPRREDPAITEGILRRAAALDPRYADAEVLGVVVGDRPARPQIRVDAEGVRTPAGHRVFAHNYGHGGAGITLSWGCAEALADAIAACLERG